MDIKILAEMLHPLERSVIVILKENMELREITAKTKLQEVEAMRALQWLENKEIIKTRAETRETISLDANGLNYINSKLPERRFLESLTKEISLKEIQEKANLTDEELTISIGILKKKAAIEFINNKVKLTAAGQKLLGKESLEEKFLKKLPLDQKSLSDEDKYAYEELKKRKLIIKTDVQKLRFVSLTDLYKKLSKEKIDLNVIGSLTPELIKSGEWKNKKFRRYDLKINVPQIPRAKRHFVNQAINYARRIWLDMGFKEMQGDIINTSFWNFDALFVPQDHPAREMQDTFFIKNPSHGKIFNKELMKKIKETHENGWSTNSKGWQYSWNEEIAKRNLPRTHTTVLSSITLSKLSEKDLPVKLFAIGRCYRNEALDWSHLFEFNQTEGIVIDENANLRHLMGYLREFANKMGYPKLRFRPAYFPYTSNGLEGDVYDPIHKKWIEFIAAGIFRPEVVKPLLGKEIPVLAWGPGLDRMISASYGLKDIRDLYKNDIKQLREIKEWL